MGGGKAAISSVAVWSGVVAIAAQAAKLVFGYDIVAADQLIIVGYVQQIVELVSTGATILAGIGAIWGRVRARKKITGIVSP